MTTTLILVIALLILFLWNSDSLPRQYRIRTCAGKKWKTSFPSASKKEIREFLLFFVNAFAFNDSNKLKFEPDDRLIDIYKNLYPHKWQADALEFETLAGDLNDIYGIHFDEIWHDRLTLGELFKAIKMPKNV